MEKNVSSHYRGLHVVCIDQETGEIKVAQVFDTYRDSIGIEYMTNDEDKFSQGDIVVAACKDDCQRKLSKTAKQWFANLGSKEIW